MRKTTNPLSRAICISAGLVLLAGCATQPLTPEQQANLIRLYGIQAAQQQAAYQTQMQAITAIGRPAPPVRVAPTSCITSYVGTVAYTNCR